MINSPISFREKHILQILHLYFKQNLPLDLFIHHYFKNHKCLGSKDRAFISETIYTIIRWKSLYQALTKGSSCADWLALFKTHSIEMLRSEKSLAPEEVAGFPGWLYKRLCDRYGDIRAMQLCEESNKQAPQAIRVNRLVATREELKAELEKTLPVKLSPHSPEGLIIAKRTHYFDLPAYKRGAFEVQDEGSQLLARLVDAKPSDQVLDFCAGSGGKALAIAANMQGKGQIYLHDVRSHALLDAKKRCRRAHVQNVQFLVSGDPKLQKLKGKMDWVLVDAPCSGTGTLRRNPDMKWRLAPEEILRLQALQREIFKKALEFLSPRGKIVYATCSLLPEENEEQADYFLKTYPLLQEGALFQTFPETDGPDGFFGVVMKFRNEVK